MSGTPLLFQEYPRLARAIPHVPLGVFPTPVERLTAVGRELGHEHLYIKRDDLSGSVYGGNKVRKLEFLLGEALQHQARSVITVGFAGSNHALATAIYARQLGLKSTSLLMPQVNAHYVQANLLASHYHGADVRLCRNMSHLCCDLGWQQVCGLFRDTGTPRFIPAGGTSPLGILGYVEAAFELRQQIAAGQLPVPDRIYLPFASMGTTAGLLLGCRLAGLQSRIIAVRVIEKKRSGIGRLLAILRRSVDSLRRIEPAIPHLSFTAEDVSIRDEFLGGGYAHVTPGGEAATALLKMHAGIDLNGAYSAKAFAALMADTHGPELKSHTVLYWNTWNSRDLSMMASGVDYHTLPHGFHRYFTENVR